MVRFTLCNKARWRSGNAGVCKTSMHGFDPRSRLHEMASALVVRLHEMASALGVRLHEMRLLEVASPL